MGQPRKHVIEFTADLTHEQEDFIRRAITEVTGTILHHHRSQPNTIDLDPGEELTEAQVPEKARAEGRVTVTGTVDQDEFMNSYDTYGRTWGNDHFDMAHHSFLAFGVPHAPEVKVIGVEGDSFLIQYSTELVNTEGKN